MEEKVQNDYKNDDKNDIALQSKDKVDRNESKKEK